MIQVGGTQYFRLIPGVSRPSGDDAGSSDCVLARAKAGTVTAGECPRWKAVDGGQWFMRATTMRSIGQGGHDPNGDYCPDTLLNLRTYKSISMGRLPFWMRCWRCSGAAHFAGWEGMMAQRAW